MKGQGNRWLMVLGLGSWLALSVVGFRASIVPEQSLTKESALLSLYDRSRDPSIGTELLTPSELGALLPENARDTSIVVLALGVCGDCTTKSVKADDLLVFGKHPIIGVFDGNLNDSSGNEAMKSMHITSWQHTRYEVLNASWPFRAYTIDSKGRLSALQREDETLFEFGRRACHD